MTMPTYESDPIRVRQHRAARFALRAADAPLYFRGETSRRNFRGEKFSRAEFSRGKFPSGQGLCPLREGEKERDRKDGEREREGERESEGESEVENQRLNERKAERERERERKQEERERERKSPILTHASTHTRSRKLSLPGRAVIFGPIAPEGGPPPLPSFPLPGEGVGWPWPRERLEGVVAVWRGPRRRTAVTTGHGDEWPPVTGESRGSVAPRSRGAGGGSRGRVTAPWRGPRRRCPSSRR